MVDLVESASYAHNNGNRAITIKIKDKYAPCLIDGERAEQIGIWWRVKFDENRNPFATTTKVFTVEYKDDGVNINTVYQSPELKVKEAMRFVARRVS